MRIYFDNCCFNRPFDDRTQNRIYDEGNAVLSIIKRAEDNNYDIIGSSILEYEISLMRDEEKRSKVWTLYRSTITEKINSSNEILEAAKKIYENSSIKSKDAVELASAEDGNADVFLTTDDRLIKMGTKLLSVKIRILNPIDFLGELAKEERVEGITNAAGNEVHYEDKRK